MTNVWIGWRGPGVIGEIMPDETRSEISLVPPIEIHGEESLISFLCWVETYCEQAFLVHADPQVIDATNWRDGLPAGI